MVLQKEQDEKLEEVEKLLNKASKNLEEINFLSESRRRTAKNFSSKIENLKNEIIQRLK